MGAIDFSVYFRQAVYKSAAHELEFTVSPFLVVPTGNRQIADQGYMHLGGELLLAKGFGDLPDSPSFNYLRPLALQSEVGYAARIQGPANSDVFDNLELEYSLEYLDDFVEQLDLAPPAGSLRTLRSVQLCTIVYRVAPDHEARLSTNAGPCIFRQLLRVERRRTSLTQWGCAKQRPGGSNRAD